MCLVIIKAALLKKKTVIENGFELMPRNVEMCHDPEAWPVLHDQPEFPEDSQRPEAAVARPGVHERQDIVLSAVISSQHSHSLSDTEETEDLAEDQKIGGHSYGNEDSPRSGVAENSRVHFNVSLTSTTSEVISHHRSLDKVPINLAETVDLADAGKCHEVGGNISDSGGREIFDQEFGETCDLGLEGAEERQDVVVAASLPVQRGQSLSDSAETEHLATAGDLGLEDRDQVMSPTQNTNMGSSYLPEEVFLVNDSGAAESSEVQVNVTLISAASETTGDGHSSHHHGLDSVNTMLQPVSNTASQAGAWAGQDLASILEDEDSLLEDEEEDEASLLQDEEEDEASLLENEDADAPILEDEEAVAAPLENEESTAAPLEERECVNQDEVSFTEKQEEKRQCEEGRCQVCGKFLKLGKRMKQHLRDKHKIL